MALPPSTANWHWKTKYVTPWAQTWFEQELITLKVKGDGQEEVTVDEVTEVDGDVELGQRKSKLITIYDCRIALKWSGTGSDGTKVDGSLTIPEVSHENSVDGLSDYVFDWSLSTASSGTVDKVFELAKSKLRTAIETKLAEFPSALIDIHGKDLTVSGEPSRAASPSNNSPRNTSASTTAPAVATAPTNPSVAAKSQVINTETIVLEANFQATADDLFSILTDEKRIPMWSRAMAKSKAEVGSEFSLFGGGVTGTYKSVTPGKEVVQTWKLNSPTWPAGHVGTLTTTFDQGSDFTKLTLRLAGVPKGYENEIRQNLEGYYIGGLKSIGYVQIIYSPRPPSPLNMRPRPSVTNTPLAPTSFCMRITIATIIGLLAIGATLALPWFSSDRP